MQPNLTNQSALYGVAINQICVKLDAAWQAEYHSQAHVYPLPTRSHRVVGLLQLRGEIVPVFDPSDAGNLSQGRTSVHNVLVIFVEGKWLGVVVKQEPMPVPHTQPSNVRKPSSPFEQALHDPNLASDGSGTIWWSLNAPQFFEQLSKEKSIA